VSVATIGPGKFSLDYALFHTSSLYDYLRGWWGLLISAALGLAGGIGQLAIFWRPPAKANG
jgi:putative oxidoreductase